MPLCGSLVPVGRDDVRLHQARDVGRERERDDVGRQAGLDRAALVAGGAVGRAERRALAARRGGELRGELVVDDLRGRVGDERELRASRRRRWRLRPGCQNSATAAEPRPGGEGDDGGAEHACLHGSLQSQVNQSGLGRIANPDFPGGDSCHPVRALRCRPPPWSTRRDVHRGRARAPGAALHDLDRPVFALVNLPETVKGALFARYSRYPGTLRRLFLDEFADSLPERRGAVGRRARASARRSSTRRSSSATATTRSRSSAARTSRASGSPTC